MNSPHALLIIRHLVQDTFRQAVASGICWLMLIVSGLCILVCLSVHVTGDVALRREGEHPEFLPRHTTDPAAASREGVDVVGGRLTLAFGAIPISLGRDRQDAMRFLQLVLAGIVADAAGLLLALVWTAGFLPTFLEPSAASVLLAKPAPRWSLLIGKYLGVLVFMGVQALLFVGGTWLALGLRTGIWSPGYLLCLPILLLHFAVFFSFSTFLAVCTRSTVACVFGSILFWFLCWGMNYGRHAAVAMPEMETMSPLFSFLVEAGYWIMPKPADLGVLLFDTLGAENYFGRLLAFDTVLSKGAFYPELSVLTSMLSAGVLLALATYQFAFTDY